MSPNKCHMITFVHFGREPFEKKNKMLFSSSNILLRVYSKKKKKMKFCINCSDANQFPTFWKKKIK